MGLRGCGLLGGESFGLMDWWHPRLLVSSSVFTVYRPCRALSCGFVETDCMLLTHSLRGRWARHQIVVCLKAAPFSLLEGLACMY